MMRTHADSQPIRVHDVRFTAASPSQEAEGLVGWVRFELNGVLRLDGVMLRRSVSGHLALSFPARRDRTGRDHKFVRPVTPEVGREIEFQVLRALGLEEGAPQ